MIKIKDIIDIPSLNYHITHGLTLHENVYRYSSEKFIQLFSEAREALRDGKIQLNEEDLELLESTDIGEYGLYEGEKVPLDLPMVHEAENVEKDINQLKKLSNRKERYNYIKNFSKEKLINIADELYLDYEEYDNIEDKILNSLDEAEYRGKDVPLNKPKRGGPKKFYVYTKNSKGNVVKVNFGGTTGLDVKLDQPGARASFAARHRCAEKKDKTKPGYWACNIGRYWKSLGGKRNFSGYW